MLKLYTFFINIYGLFLRLTAVFNERAKQWIDGRKIEIPNFTKKTIWVHCASLGEYEQAYPLIQKFKENESNEYPIVVSFFSPSGFSIIRKRKDVNYVCYLPLDTPKKAKIFIEKINPKLAVFVKYEFWFNHIIELQEKNIPTFFISVALREKHFLLKSYSTVFRNILKQINGISVQNEFSKNILKNQGVKNVFLSGDTRFDRVLSISNSVIELEKIKQFKNNKKLIVAGSSWQPEEQILKEFSHLKRCKIVIAPHDISENHLQQIERLFSGEITRYSEYKNQSEAVLLIDNIGLLSSVYKYADIAFVGGGFSNKLHNILEPATFGIPVIYGNNHRKFIEATEMKNFGGSFDISNAQQFIEIVTELLSDENKRKSVGKNARNYIENNAGATEIIYRTIKDNLN